MPPIQLYSLFGTKGYSTGRVQGVDEHLPCKLLFIHQSTIYFKVSSPQDNILSLYDVFRESGWLCTWLHIDHALYLKYMHFAVLVLEYALYRTLAEYLSCHSLSKPIYSFKSHVTKKPLLVSRKRGSKNHSSNVAWTAIPSQQASDTLQSQISGKLISHLLLLYSLNHINWVTVECPSIWASSFKGENCRSGAMYEIFIEDNS
jgi:hypothetical protein